MQNEKSMTVRLPGRYVDHARKIAAREGCTLSTVVRRFVSDGLRLYWGDAKRIERLGRKRGRVKKLRSACCLA